MKLPNLTLKWADALYSQHEAVFKRQESDRFVLFDYYYADYAIFRDFPETREFRGIIFDKTTGQLVSRPFHKFFNVNENPELLEENLTFKGRAYEKQDGSMAQLTSHNGVLVVASRSSLNGYVNQEVNRFLTHHPDIINFVMGYPNHTFLFEYLDPNAPIVLRPAAKELVFLNARDKNNGAYCFNTFADIVPARVTPTKELNPELWNSYFKPFLENVDNHEGFVLDLEYRGLVKVKTAWYVKSHRLVTEKSPKGFITEWASGTLDDSIAALLALGHPNVAKEAELVVAQVKVALEDSLDRLYSTGINEEMTTKEVAVLLQRNLSNPIDKLSFGVLMASQRSGDLLDKAYNFNQLRLSLGESAARIRTVLDVLNLK